MKKFNHNMVVVNSCGITKKFTNLKLLIKNITAIITTINDGILK